jgi:hydrazine synthase alpha subunit-like protein
MKPSRLCILWLAGFAAVQSSLAAPKDDPRFTNVINVTVPHISTDKSVRYDYQIVYVRAPRAGDTVHKRFYTDFSQPVTMEPGADLMLLRPDGTEELLVPGGVGSITDPAVSFDGQWVYYTHIYNLQKANQWSPPRQGADIFKIHLKTRRIVRLTDQTFTPNTGAANWSEDFRTPREGRTHFDYGVFNMGPCPLPGGRLVFTSNRDGFRPSKGYPAVALQLFVMDDSDDGPGRNIEKIGHLNIAGALHPVVLADGRIMFSTLESQGLRSEILWGLWSIHPDGTSWAPLVSAFDHGGAPNGFHFQTQVSDGSLIVEEYYNQNNSGFGAYIKLPPRPPNGSPAFGPAHMASNPAWRYGRYYNAKPKWYQMPFMPVGSVSLTPFSHGLEGPADEAMLGDKNSPKVGKFTHPSGAPNGHLLTVYSPGPVNHQYTHLPQVDGGIYLIRNSTVVEEPAQMLLVKNDPNYNESWPRAVVAYERIYGIKEPKRMAALANDGTLSKYLPAGTPFGLVGTSSLYKRESYPNGRAPEGKVTATYAGKNDPWRGLDAFTSHGNGMPLNFHNQGSDVGLYENSDIHAIRILAMEPTTDRHRGANTGRRFYNHASERLRILGEIPVRKFDADRGQPKDPDGNPDTSFLARIPADTAFTFQTLDKRGMVLNTAQTWHQLRPGEIRNNCGGCHAHSQKPTEFNLTMAARPDYKLWDLVNRAPLLTSKNRDESKQQWNVADDAGLKYASRDGGAGVVNVEYWRDIKPILQRSCAACHTARRLDWAGRASESAVTSPATNAAGNLDLDADDELVQRENEGKFPGTYYRLALDEHARFGHKPIGYDSWGYPNASRYIRKMQSRRSLLVWKIFGERLDGFSNDDHPSEPEPGAGYFAHKGERVPTEKNRHRYDLDFLGGQMPPPDAIAGKYKGPDGQLIKVAPLTDEDRFTLVRWIDLGCPVDLDYDPAAPTRRSFGWMLDDNRPILTVTSPRAGANASFDRILIGAHDYYTGLDPASFTVTADFAIDGIVAGENLAPGFKPLTQGVWELRLASPLKELQEGRLVVSVKDRQGNVTRIDRTFSAGSVHADEKTAQARARR